MSMKPGQNTKVLFVASVESHFISFHLPYLKWLKEQGAEVHVACSGDMQIPFTDKKHTLTFERSPYKLNNIKAYKELKKIIDSEDFKFIHCHTPMASVITRLSAKKARKRGTKVIYTAHGFHFTKGGPWQNWALYYPIEKILSRYMDCLITINEEDYSFAKKSLYTKDIRFVNGVGVDTDKMQKQTEEKKLQLRKSCGYKAEDFILFFAGELSYRKHQDLLIKAVALVKEEIPDIKLLLAGDGALMNKYKQMVEENKLEKQVLLLGYSSEVVNLLLLSDISVSSSRREGLPVNVMEGMAAGLPLIVTDSRGNRDLIINNENGYVVDIEDEKQFAQAIIKLYKNPDIRKKFAENNLRDINKYSLHVILQEMIKIYAEYLV